MAWWTRGQDTKHIRQEPPLATSVQVQNVSKKQVPSFSSFFFKEIFTVSLFDEHDVKLVDREGGSESV